MPGTAGAIRPVSCVSVSEGFPYSFNYLFVEEKKTTAKLRDQHTDKRITVETILLLRNAMHSSDCAIARCLSVCPFVRRLSVTCRYCVKTAKRVLKRCSPSECHTILVVPYQTVWQYILTETP